MRWECGAPLWAWCCYGPGTSCGKRWKATRRWRREGLHERSAGRKDEPSGRNDTPALHRAATGSRARAGSVRAHAGVRHVPDAAARSGARIAAADARDAGRRRAAALTDRAISGTRPAVDAMDLGTGIWTGGHGSLRALFGIYSTLAAAIGKSGIRRIEPAGAADFSGRNVERMAIRDDTFRSAGDADAGGAGSDVLPPADPAWFGAGDGVGGVIRGGGAAIEGLGDGNAQGRFD